jgi:hypothetical protein
MKNKLKPEYQNQFNPTLVETQNVYHQDTIIYHLCIRSLSWLLTCKITCAKGERQCERMKQQLEEDH